MSGPSCHVRACAPRGSGQEAVHGRTRRDGDRQGAYADALEEANQTIRDQNLTIATLRRELAEAYALALLVKEVAVGGLKAYRDEFKKAHPNSPVLAPSGQRYKSDGVMKPMGTIAYDREFDRILREARISDPTKYRD